MQTFLLRYIRVMLLTLCLTAPVLRGRAQTVNKPQTGQTSPAGTVSSTLPDPPPAITVNTSDLYNYVRSFTPRVPIDDPAQLTTATAPAQAQVSTLYKDGFNRSMQAVQHHIVPGKSLVAPSDTRFRTEETGYLPYVVNGSGFRANAYNEQQQYYNGLYPGEGPTAYSRLRSNTQAGKRNQMSYAPGKSQVGQGRATETDQFFNIANQVINWSVDQSGNPVNNGYYAAGTLFVEQTKQPDFNASDVILPPVSRIYKDRNGRVILEEKADSAATGYFYRSTYYIYDDMGRLRLVAPPKAVEQAQLNSWTLNNTIRDQYCFQYRYDGKGRKVEQKIPGKGWEYFVYDKRDRVVMSQDANLIGAGQWRFVLYDIMDRPLCSGIYQPSGPESRTLLQSVIDNQVSYTEPYLFYYINSYQLYQVYPGYIEACTPLVYTYYDNYENADGNGDLWSTYDSELQFTEQQNIAGSETPQRSNRTMGLPTGSRVKILPSPSAETNLTGAWRHTALFYDDKGRPIYSASRDLDENKYIAHASYSGSQYSFSGQVLNTKQVLINNKYNDGYPRHSEVSRNEYDANTGRLDKTWRRVDNATAWTLTGTYTYDELGRLQRKVLGNNGETQDFGYNIRGQLTGINGVYAETGNKQGQNITFGESLKYDYGFDQLRYDGKIAGMIWRGSGPNTHAYGYDYDLSGMLRRADYNLRVVGGWSHNDLDFSVSNLYYDKNGNIKSMTQRGVDPANGPVDMDILSYSYTNGNRLDAVKDNGVPDFGAGDFQDGHTGAGDYSYDGNGNLTLDQNKGIGNVTYNHFNKPVTILLPGGKQIEYSYDAAGAKVQELVIVPGQALKRTDYISNFVYQNDSLQYALTADGRTAFNYTTANPIKEEYFVKDHLGNVRSSIDITTYSIRQYLATYEVASANLEGLLFDKVGEIRDEKPGSTDPEDNKAGRLNASEAGRETGTSLLVKVMAGDQVDMNVNNYYESYDSKNDKPLRPEEMLQSVISTLTNGSGGLPGESHNTKLVNQLFTQSNFSALEQLTQAQGIDPARPQAYLTYALFDESMKLVAEFAGAYQVNGNGGWASIGSNGARVIPTNGYLAVYLNSRWRDLHCNPCSNIFFDKLNVEVSKGNLLEESHYYPHGLPIKPLSSVQAPSGGYRDNRRKYQSNEYIQDLGLNWMSFGARQYDPQIGRFLSVDPLADAQGQQVFSPYAAMGNAPESMVDPNGMAFGPQYQDRAMWDFNPWQRVSAVNTFANSSLEWIEAAWGDYSNGLDMGSSGRVTEYYYEAAQRKWSEFVTANSGGSGASASASTNDVGNNKNDGDGVSQESNTQSPPSNVQSKGKKALKIAGSFVATDPKKTTLGKILQVASRFTWELPQQLIGVLTAEVTNLFGGIESAENKNGALVLGNKWMPRGAGFTLGNILTVGEGSRESVISHEYGHYIQSRRFGIGYLIAFALPSVVRAELWSIGILKGDYNNFYTESNATQLGYKYWKP
ncbi:RHS repeat protein [Taibaiella koreensis]|uniref:RHS repeat protein n=1 Tax=Taibaiella koreensis TaxID=1268548 RepID=UPI000E5A0805|nr:RHS repeat-associated core domain-containing protein [Taibaiella koreensis]